MQERDAPQDIRKQWWRTEWTIVGWTGVTTLQRKRRCHLQESKKRAILHRHTYGIRRLYAQRPPDGHAKANDDQEDTGIAVSPQKQQCAITAASHNRCGIRAESGHQTVRLLPSGIYPTSNPESRRCKSSI